MSREVTERQHQLVRMRYIDGNDIAEIAALLKSSERSVSRELQRIRRMIDKMNALQVEDRFCCDTATEDEMRERCRRMGKGQEWSDFCVDAFVRRMPRKALAAKYVYEESTVKRYKHDRRRELER